MKTLVRKALSMTGVFNAEAAIIDYHHYIKNEEQLARARLAKERSAMINNWLSLLNYDERFVVQKHLVEGLEWSRVILYFEKHWDGLFTRSNRQLCIYQANALRKICEYCNTFPEITLELFGDLLSKEGEPMKDKVGEQPQKHNAIEREA